MTSGGSDGGGGDGFTSLAPAIVEARDEAVRRKLAADAAQAIAPDGDAAAVVIAAARTVEDIRAGLDAEQAFTHLRRRSMDENRKVIDVAQEIVGTRRRPQSTPG